MAEEAVDCIVRNVRLKNSDFGPVIVSFEHGCINGDNARSLRCGVYSQNGKQVVGVVADRGDILYKGYLNRDDNDICQTFVAIRNRNSNKVRLIEASSAVLSPHFESLKPKDSDEPLDKKKASLDLSLAFGSKKSKRVADQKKRMSLNVDVIKHKATALIDGVEFDGNASEPSNDDSLAALLPPCNRSALTTSQAYPISGILSEEELGSLETAAEQFADGTAKSPKLCLFCGSLATQIKSDRVKNLALLLYVQCLVDFLGAQRDKILSSKKIICPYSDLVWNRLLRDFMTSGQKSRSASMEDKAIAYIIILNFHIGSDICDVSRLAESIKCRNLTLTRIKYIASVVGAVKHSDSTDHVILVFPLRPLPRPPKAQRSKRRR